MTELGDLYQEVILDHNRRPRNFHKMGEASRHAEGFNPLCGDRLTVYLELEGDVVRDVSFEGSGCAISKASASLMTESVKGRTLRSAETLFKSFHELVTGEAEGTSTTPNDLGKLVVFSGVRDFPVRVKCATLAWHTLRAALENRQEIATTE
jgi:nitrogen fixation NifU-like protein